MRPPTLLLLLGLVLGLASPLRGQQVRVVGLVVDEESGQPLATTSVIVRRADGTFLRSLVTDSLGKFEFIVTRTFAVRLFAQRIGYRSAGTPLLHFDGHRYLQVEVRLHTDAVLLAPLEVIVWSDVDRSPLLDDFRFRSANGTGLYITRRDIEARRPMYVTDMLRSVPGVQLVGGGAGTRPRIELGRGAGERCITQIFVDGMLMNRTNNAADIRLDDVVSPGSVEGIEIYRGFSSIPPEFLNSQSQCGVVAVWTRRGGTVRR
ncbi:MAG TPA: TonB-dependent receptor plug domain-containing protein [Longimicrobiales bacterium]|nr:TonB-dependent receptor plug domain-containing protein [Longimicrobiales bacterium]